MICLLSRRVCPFTFRFSPWILKQNTLHNDLRAVLWWSFVIKRLFFKEPNFSDWEMNWLYQNIVTIGTAKGAVNCQWRTALIFWRYFWEAIVDSTDCQRKGNICFDWFILPKANQMPFKSKTDKKCELQNFFL